MLTEQQQTIVKSDDKKSIVLASAGSGKTFVLTNKIEYLIKEKKVDPTRIYVFSFSRSATSEMRKKLNSTLTKEQFEQLYISTFHSFCYHLLQEYPTYAGVKKNMNILAEDQLKGIIKKSISYMMNNGKINNEISPDTIIEYYSYVRWHLTLPEDMEAPDIETKKVLENVITYMEKIDSYTFNDLIIICTIMLMKYPSIAEEVRNKFDILILDECQDTQVIVTQMLDVIIDEHHTFCIMGDVCQTLYRFNKSDPFELLKLANKWNSKIFYLNETFRFGNTISTIANNICEDMEIDDKYKIPTKTNQSSEPTTFVIGEEADRFQYVADQIKSLHIKGIPYDNIFILSRVNSQLGKYAQALMENGIPAVLKGGNILQRKEVKFVFAVLQCFKKVNIVCLDIIFENYNVGYDNTMISKLFDDFKGDTIFNLVEHVNTTKIKDIGEERKKAFTGVARKILDCYQFIESKSSNIFMDIATAMDMKDFKFMNKKDETGTGNEERYDILKLLNEIYCSQFKGDLLNFENYMKVTFASDTETKSKAVCLFTVHASKGMSLPYVFLDISKFATFPDYDLLDEQFCLYVGVTRAKYKLWFVSNKTNPFNAYMHEEPVVISKYDEDGMPEYDPNAERVFNKPTELSEVKTEVNFSTVCLGTKTKCTMLIEPPKSIVRQTEKACMLSWGTENSWIPKSNIFYDKERNNFFASSWWIKQGNTKFLKRLK